jgi:hypothetical protein
MFFVRYAGHVPRGEVVVRLRHPVLRRMSSRLRSFGRRSGLMRDECWKKRGEAGAGGAGGAGGAEEVGEVGAGRAGWST